ncbi:MAG: hypothetical protein C7B44_02355 [Sulfobacillus thermosulfidooxidans]|nr:MAG: hypothetical protein C7B44_02355 [Sulfobacillus thermosulfidooxidans]
MARTFTVSLPASGSSVKALVLALWRAGDSRRLGFITFIIITAFYSLFLPEASTQQLRWQNWHYLTPMMGLYSVGFGMVISWVVVVQWWAMKQTIAFHSQASSMLAVVVSALPNLLCCTPILPSLLAFAGIPLTSLWRISGPIQGFFAIHATAIEGASLLFAVLMAYWATRRMLHGACALQDGCSTC